MSDTNGDSTSSATRPGNGITRRPTVGLLFIVAASTVIGGWPRPRRVPSGIGVAMCSRKSAVLVIEQPEHLVHGPLISELAAKYKLPSICPQDPGALIAYGVDFVLGFRRMAEYMDAILRGAKPAEMPLEQIDKYQLIINLKVAKALGLTIPPSLLLRADQVLE